MLKGRLRVIVQRISNRNMCNISTRRKYDSRVGKASLRMRQSCLKAWKMHYRRVDWIDLCGQLVFSSELFRSSNRVGPAARTDRNIFDILRHTISNGRAASTMHMSESSDGASVWRWRSIVPRVRILKNILMLTFCVAAAVGATLLPLLTFLASAAELKVLAPLSLFVFYSAATVSHLTGRAFFGFCRHKIAIVMGMLPILFLLAATSFAQQTTLILASVLVGLMQGPLWTASFGYLIGMAKQLQYYSNQTDLGLVPMLLGFFNACIALGEFFGYSLTAGAFMASEMVENRSTKAWAPYDWAECGRRFCNRAEQRQWPSLPSVAIVDDSQESVWDKLTAGLALRSTVVPIYSESLFVCFVTFAVFVASFSLGKLIVRTCDHDSLHYDRPRPRMEVLRIIMSRKFQFLLPLTVFLGWSEAFLHADVSKAFVACIMPQSLLGSVLGVSSGVTVFLHVFLVAVFQHTSRLTTVYGGAIVGLGSAAVMWMWRPMSDDQPILYVIACSWQMMTTVMKAAVQTVTYLLFPDRVDLALAAYNTCKSFGAAVSFSLFLFDCFEAKLCLCAAMLVLSLIPYTWLEIKYTSFG